MGPKRPERWSCPERRHGSATENFRGRAFLDGDPVDSYKKTDRLRDRPTPERWACAWRRHGLALKNFRDRKLLDGDSADSYKNYLLARSAQTRSIVMPMTAAWIGYQKKKLGANTCWMAILLIPIKKMFACKIGPNSNDGHARGGGVG